MLCHGNWGCKEGTRGVSVTGCASGQEQDGSLLFGGLLCIEGCISVQTSYKGYAFRISAVILTAGQPAAAFSSASSGGSGRVVGRIHTAASCLLQLILALPLLALCYPFKKALYS